MHKIMGSFAIDVSDNRREQGKIIGALEPAVAALEAEIEKVTGQKVSIDMGSRRVTGPRAAKPVVPADSPSDERAVLAAPATEAEEPEATPHRGGRHRAEAE